MEAERCGVKDVERILAVELHNWRRWANQRSYLPASVKCVLGQLYIRSEEEKAEEMRFRDEPPPVESEAEEFEKVINSLPARMRRAFLLYQLDRGHVGLITVKAKRREHKAAIMGVGVRQFNQLCLHAHQLLLQRWTVVNGIQAEDDD